MYTKYFQKGTAKTKQKTLQRDWKEWGTAVVRLDDLSINDRDS